MQIPKRKPGKYAHVPVDPHLTRATFDALQKQLENVKSQHRPAVVELQRLAELGDFSENAAYQMAKGRLRAINDKIFELSQRLKHAVIITGSTSDRVELGSAVTVEINGKQAVYRVLGSSETNPGKGIISHHSPIGVALMGKKVGDRGSFKLPEKEVFFQVIKIN